MLGGIVHVNTDTQEGQKRALDHRELRLQVVVRIQTLVLGTKLRTTIWDLGIKFKLCHACQHAHLSAEH